MGFSTAQYAAVIEGLIGGTHELDCRLRDVETVAMAVAGHWYLPPGVGAEISRLAEAVVQIGRWLLDTTVELLKGAFAPVYLFGRAWEWQDLHAAATGVGGELQSRQHQVDRFWQGDAAQRYAGTIPAQAAAAAGIGAIADRTASSLTVCATASLAFYLALGVILVRFTAATIAAIAALGSVVFSPVGLALIVEEAGVNTAAILALVGVLIGVLGVQAQQMVSLHGATADGGAFPGGAWPT
jgi:uncharacterized protein YukE